MVRTLRLPRPQIARKSPTLAGRRGRRGKNRFFSWAAICGPLRQWPPNPPRTHDLGRVTRRPHPFSKHQTTTPHTTTANRRISIKTPATPPIMHNKLFIPGPIDVSPATFAAMSRPLIGHRGAEFEALYASTQPGLQALLGTKRPVFLS